MSETLREYTKTLQGEAAQLRSDLAQAQQEAARLRTENAALSAHTRALVTYEADAKHAQRQAELVMQACYRCSHPSSRPEDNCECCQNDHTPNADGTFG